MSREIMELLRMDPEELAKNETALKKVIAYQREACDKWKESDEKKAKEKAKKKNETDASNDDGIMSMTFGDD